MSPAPEAAPPWQVLIGAFEPEHIEAELAAGVPLLLVPNNPDLAVELARQFQERPQGRLHFSRELIGAEDGEVCWYRYNDPRFDGVSPPEELLPRVANLRLRDLSLHRVTRLDSLIHGWGEQDPALAALVSAGGGRLWLQSKLPVPIVAGVSGVVELIGTFCWTPLGSLDAAEDAAAAADLATLAGWLESSCFVPAERRRVDAHAAAISLVWRQDPLRLEVQRRQRLERQLAALAAEKQALTEEKRALEEEREAQAQALAAATSALEAAEARLNELQAQLAALATGREALLAEAAARQAKAERLEQALAVLAEEKQALAEEKQALAAEKQALEEEREAQVQDLAAATSGREAAEVQLNDLQGQLAALAAGREVLLAEAAARQAEAERLEQELASLAEGKEVLRADLAAAISGREAAEAQIGDLQAQRLRRGDLRVCTDLADPRYGTLQVLLSGSGEPELWEAAVAAAPEPGENG